MRCVRSVASTGETLRACVARRPSVGPRVTFSDDLGSAPVVEVPEQRAVISGIGISRIGRKTGIGGLELTTESVTAAIADAGLEVSDIDAIATLGETPADEVAQALQLRNDESIAHVPTGGLFAPVMGAFLAVASGRVRHVLVYRTVQMLGG